MARPRNKPPDAPATSPADAPAPEQAKPADAPAPEQAKPAARAAAPAPEPKLPIAGDDGDADEAPAPVGRPSKAGATPPPVKRPTTPAGRRSSGAFVEGRRVVANAQTETEIRIKASEHPNFILTHDPARWGYYPQCDRILPDFGKIRLVPGIGRVDSKGRPDAALVDANKAGRTVIYDRDVPGGYLREFDMLGGTGFLLRYERIRVSGRHAAIVVDHDAFSEFADQLVEDGTIEPPGEQTLAWLRDQAVNMIRLSEPRRTSASVAAEIAIYEKQIAACDRLLAEGGA